MECPNFIRILQSHHPLARYTCLMHALGFTEKPEYIEIAKYGFEGAYAGPEFAHWLLDRQLLAEISKAGAADLDLVFYFNTGRFRHAGVLLASGRIVSKWGTGHLFEHELFEIPMQYGEEARFFQKLTYNQTFLHFADFALEKMA